MYISDSSSPVHKYIQFYVLICYFEFTNLPVESSNIPSMVGQWKDWSNITYKLIQIRPITTKQSENNNVMYTVLLGIATVNVRINVCFSSRKKL